MLTIPSLPSQDRLAGWTRRAVRLIMPVDCLACHVGLTDDPVPFFCRTCWQRIAPLSGPSCSTCDQPFVSAAATSWTQDHRCQHCVARPPSFRRAWTLFPYISPLREAICAFKYQRKVALAEPLAALMLSALPASLEGDLIMPVPLHPARLRGREFNQSLLLADRLARRLRKPVCIDGLVRMKETDPQTTLSRPERLRNLRRTFAVSHAQTVAGRRVLLVDDVFTTGTTLNECARALSDAGAESVEALTLARTMDASLIPDRLFVEPRAAGRSALGV
ncbi:MAG TPA: ComF family protein [Nitrospira sp.]|nr:ComF family protein [Nitrospira sp.]